MRNIYVFIAFLLIMSVSVDTYAQSCIPDETVVDTADPGQISPMELPYAVQGEYYDETVTIIPPGEYEGLDVIEAIRIDSVVGLPPGINWWKNEDEFAVTDPDTRYCVNLYGTPTEQGNFPLTLYITPRILFGIEGPQQVDDTSLSIFVDHPVGILPSSLAASTRAYPNPFQSETQISFYSTKSNVAKLVVYNLLGNVIYKEEMLAIPGKNTFFFKGRNLAAGSYIYTIKMGDKTETQRLMKSN